MNNSGNLSLEELVEYEAYAQSICFQTEDHHEAVNSFFEKRAPKFKGC
jgi:2-(1,2-epoxy-1,2-dihydrophenyl)acetyl-CoA isomerase